MVSGGREGVSLSRPGSQINKMSNKRVRVVYDVEMESFQDMRRLSDKYDNELRTEMDVYDETLTLVDTCEPEIQNEMRMIVAMCEFATKHGRELETEYDAAAARWLPIQKEVQPLRSLNMPLGDLRRVYDEAHLDWLLARDDWHGFFDGLAKQFGDELDRVCAMCCTKRVRMCAPREVIDLTDDVIDLTDDDIDLTEVINCRPASGFLDKLRKVNDMLVRYQRAPSESEVSLK